MGNTYVGLMIEQYRRKGLLGDTKFDFADCSRHLRRQQNPTLQQNAQVFPGHLSPGCAPHV
jgi:hypothetical protein